MKQRAFRPFPLVDLVYTGMDPNESVQKLAQTGFSFTLELTDLYRYGSAIHSSLGSLFKVFPFGSVAA